MLACVADPGTVKRLCVESDIVAKPWLHQCNVCELAARLQCTIEAKTCAVASSAGRYRENLTSSESAHAAILEWGLGWSTKVPKPKTLVLPSCIGCRSMGQRLKQGCVDSNDASSHETLTSQHYANLIF